MGEGLKDVRQVTEVTFEPEIDYRGKFLSDAVVKPELFGNERYLQNLSEIYGLIVNNGRLFSEFKGDYGFRLSSVTVGNNAYGGVVETFNFPQNSRARISIFKCPEDWEGKPTIEDFTFSSSGGVSGKLVNNDGRSGFFEGYSANLGPDITRSLNRFTGEVLEHLLPLSENNSKYLVDSDFANGTSERSKVLSHLKRTIRVEKDSLYAKNRDKEQYLKEFFGLNGTLQYVESLGQHMRVVDVGTGNGNTWANLTKGYKGDLEFWATNLVYDKHLVDLFGDRIKFTPVEFMKGFDNESVGGILGLKSVAYSPSPEMAIKRIDQILVPGGVFKSSFRKPKDDYDAASYGCQTHQKFTEQLLKLGYDVAISPDKSVVLAIKPGGKERAVDVFNRDIESLKQNPLLKKRG